MFKLIVASLLLLAVGSDAFTNPISANAPDPWMVYYNGYYYLIATTWSNYFGIRKSSTLAGLQTAENEVVYTFDGNAAWAPELHYVDGKWYLYYCSSPGNQTANSNHRNRVAESEGDDPMGPYTHKADLVDDGDGETLDPSLIQINGKYYLIASYFDGTQKLYIRELTNPYTLASGQKHLLSEPTLDWEIQGWTVNEGPEPLYHDNRTFIVYSASYCATENYKLGLLEFIGTDPLNITHWKKYPDPVFEKSVANGVYGPGHNGFFKSPDGTEDWIVYHANNSTSGGCDMNRSSRAQKFTWGTDGLPVFGTPVAEGVELEEPSAVGSDAFTNPIAANAPDPWMVYYEGFYYLIATTWNNYFGIRKASTLAGLKSVKNEVVYTFDGNTGWAPEIHQVDGKWYLYYTACSGNTNTTDVACQRNHVAEIEGDDPMGPYTFEANFVEDGDPMALDSTLVTIIDKYYLVASYNRDVQKLYIRELTNPYTLASGEKHLLSTPEYDWETEGGSINEGPEPLYHNGRTFIVYSASNCTTENYKLGLLELIGTDPLNITHWMKYPDPVFQKNETTAVYGPGHNGFFKSPDGTEDWIVYHANNNTSGGCDMNRSSRAQKFTWSDDGLPVFGVPEAVGVELEAPSGE